MKKEVDTATVIPINGLASGVHTFGFTLERRFFGQFENQEISDAHIEATVVLEKQNGWFRLDVTLEGTLVRSCDHCLQDISLPFHYNAPVVVTFSEALVEEEGDETIIIDLTATEIDLTQYLYDSVCVSLPLQSIHPPGQCDPVMEQKIAELTIN